MKRCIVIGGNGFIGKNVVQELLQQDRQVTVFDISEVHKFGNNVNYVDISNFADKDLAEIIYGHEEIVDLAYSTNPKTSYDDPLKDIIENLERTVRIFSLATKSNSLKKYLYVSSGGAVYGNTQARIITETHKTVPISPYGITKLAIEKYGFMFNNNQNFPFLVVRPSNAYGPGQIPNRGQGFIAQAIYNILHNTPVEIFGKQGTIRDYIFISDLAKGILSVLNYGNIGEVYNIGSGIGFSNRNIMGLIAGISKKYKIESVININEKRKFDVNKNILDCKKIRKQSGWKAEVTLQEGLTKTWNYFYDKS